MARTIFSVGYENLTPGALAKLVKQLDACLVDIRSIPYGRIKQGFGRTQLGELLGERYVWAGMSLGGFVKQQSEGTTDDGLQWLRGVAKGRIRVRGNCPATFPEDAPRVIIMCQEYQPMDCHRHHLVGIPMKTRFGVDVHHIIEDEVVDAAELQRAGDQGTEYMCRDLEDVIREAW
jgi:uncharacterized protein (DUF488 family)